MKKKVERCGAYAESWKELGKLKGWKGCSLPKGHEGNHREEGRKKWKALGLSY
jgi:hypothetical protein